MNNKTWEGPNHKIKNKIKKGGEKGKTGKKRSVMW